MTLHEREPREQPTLTKSGGGDCNRTPPATPRPFSGRRRQSDSSVGSSKPLSKQPSASGSQRLSANGDRRKMPPGTQPPVKLGKVKNALPSSLQTRSVIAYSAMGFGDAPLTRWHCTTLRTRLLRLPSYSWASRMSSAATGSLLPRRQAPVAPPSTHRRRRRCVDSFPPNRPTTVTSPSILGHSTAPSSWPAWVGSGCAAGLEPRVRGARHSPPQDRQPLPVEGAQPRYLQLYFYHRQRGDARQLIR